MPLCIPTSAVYSASSLPPHRPGVNAADRTALERGAQQLTPADCPFCRVVSSLPNLKTPLGDDKLLQRLQCSSQDRCYVSLLCYRCTKEFCAVCGGDPSTNLHDGCQSQACVLAVYYLIAILDNATSGQERALAKVLGLLNDTLSFSILHGHSGARDISPILMASSLADWISTVLNIEAFAGAETSVELHDEIGRFLQFCASNPLLEAFLLHRSLGTVPANPISALNTSVLFSFGNQLQRAAVLQMVIPGNEAIGEIHQTMRNAWDGGLGALWHRASGALPVPVTFAIHRVGVQNICGHIHQTQPPNDMYPLATEVVSAVENLPDGVYLQIQQMSCNCIVAYFIGPKGTAWEGGAFCVEIHFPADHPNSPPAVRLGCSVADNFDRAVMRMMADDMEAPVDNQYNFSLVGWWGAGKTVSDTIKFVQSSIFPVFKRTPEPRSEEDVKSDLITAFYHKRIMQIWTVKTAMLPYLENRAQGAGAHVLDLHWRMHRQQIANMVREWCCDGNDGIRVFRGNFQAQRCRRADSARYNIGNRRGEHAATDLLERLRMGLDTFQILQE